MPFVIVFCCLADFALAEEVSPARSTSESASTCMLQLHMDSGEELEGDDLDYCNPHHGCNPHHPSVKAADDPGHWSWESSVFNDPDWDVLEFYSCDFGGAAGRRRRIRQKEEVQYVLDASVVSEWLAKRNTELGYPDTAYNSQYTYKIGYEKKYVIFGDYVAKGAPNGPDIYMDYYGSMDTNTNRPMADQGDTGTVRGSICEEACLAIPECKSFQLVQARSSKEVIARDYRYRAAAYDSCVFYNAEPIDGQWVKYSSKKPTCFIKRAGASAMPPYRAGEPPLRRNCLDRHDSHRGSDKWKTQCARPVDYDKDEDEDEADDDDHGDHDDDDDDDGDDDHGDLDDDDDDHDDDHDNAASECEDVEVTIGPGGRGSKTLRGLDVTECPAVVDKSNWKTPRNYGDSFNVEVKDGDVIVTRRDKPDNSWGMDLKFVCKRCEAASDAAADQGVVSSSGGSAPASDPGSTGASSSGLEKLEVAQEELRAAREQRIATEQALEQKSQELVEALEQVSKLETRIAGLESALRIAELETALAVANGKKGRGKRGNKKQSRTKKGQ